MITWHVETSGGARFEYADDEEEMRRQMIEYYNDTCRDPNQHDELAEDTEFEEVREAIEEYENFSYEEVHESCLPKVHVAVFDSDNGTQTSVHLSYRNALKWVADQADVTLANADTLSDQDYAEALGESLDSDDWYVVHEEEIQP
jgi:hypothetical protein